MIQIRTNYGFEKIFKSSQRFVFKTHFSLKMQVQVSTKLPDNLIKTLFYPNYSIVTKWGEK